MSKFIPTQSPDVPNYAIACMGLGLIIGVLFFLGYALYAVYQFLPVWFGGIFTFIFFSPFVVGFVVLMVMAGIFVGVWIGVGVSFCILWALRLFKLINKVALFLNKKSQ